MAGKAKRGKTPRISGVAARDDLMRQLVANTVFPLRRCLRLAAVATLLLTAVWAQTTYSSALQVSHYDLALRFNFPAHQLDVTAKVAMTTQQPLATAAFLLNQSFTVKSVLDGNGQALSSQRLNNQILVSFPSPLPANSQQTLTFHYTGTLASANFSPINGIRTAYVGPEGSFLLYPAEWFPMVHYGTDRFTATITATLPPPYGLIASGRPSATPKPDNTVVYTYTQDQPTFPGSVVVTSLRPQSYTDSGLVRNFYFSNDVPAALTEQYAQSALRIYGFLNAHLGTAPTNTLHFIELPDDALPSFSSPDMIFLSHNSIGRQLNYRLLVDEIAQQWFGNLVSPATLNDAWLQYGSARFFEALYVEQEAGKTAYNNLVGDLQVGALSYPDTALANSSHLYPFSPEFQDLNYDKGAMLFHMLRWVIGDQNLFASLKQFVAANAWKPVTTAQFEQTLERQGKQDLRAFFTEWYRGTGVPQFQNQYVVYRLGTGGYRVTGTLRQPLDLFQMPVELAIKTDAATVMRRIEVIGTNSPYTVDAPNRPHDVIIDPNNWILKSTPETQLRVYIARGDNLIAAGDFPNALKQYQQALKVNPISSLAHYRIAEANYQEQNWQEAANEYREAMNGDLKPRWVEVWSHIQLGKIFDQTGQRDRAINEYQLALQTHDNTDGALQYARQYLQTPYKPAKQG